MDTRRIKRRSPRALTASVLAGAVLLSGCSFFYGTATKADVEDHAYRELAEAGGEVPPVVCEGGLVLKKGERTNCSLRDYKGTVHEFAAIVFDAKGDWFAIEIDPWPSLPLRHPTS